MLRHFRFRRPTPKITRSFYFYFVFFCSLVGRRFAVCKIENGSVEEMEEKWRRRRFVSRQSVVLLSDEISVSGRNRKINDFRINFSSWTTNTLAASLSWGDWRINEQQRIVLWWGGKKIDSRDVSRQCIWAHQPPPNGFSIQAEKRQKGWKYHVRALVPLSLQSADK